MNLDYLEFLVLLFMIIILNVILFVLKIDRKKVEI